MTEQESNSLQKNLTAALLKASGETTTTQPTNRAANKPDRIAKIMRQHTHLEEMGECPQCSYKAPLSDFETGEESSDSDSDGFETDESTSRTDGDDDVENLAKNLLKSAQLAAQKNQPLHLTRREDEPALTKEAAAELIAKALKSMRR
jgi:hypothetical protein